MSDATSPARYEARIIPNPLGLEDWGVYDTEEGRWVRDHLGFRAMRTYFRTGAQRVAAMMNKEAEKGSPDD